MLSLLLALALPFNVTSATNVQRDLQASTTYLAVEAAQLPAPTCPDGITVLVTTMTTAEGNAGKQFSPEQVWAEAGEGGCEIDLSLSFWQFYNNMEPWRGYDTRPWMIAHGCMVLTHELSHLYGLGDTTDGLGIQNGDGTLHWDIPTCNLIGYGWNHISRRDRNWLSLRGLEPCTNVITVTGYTNKTGTHWSSTTRKVCK